MGGRGATLKVAARIMCQLKVCNENLNMIYFWPNQMFCLNVKKEHYPMPQDFDANEMA
jgi:hypothetical protein